MYEVTEKILREVRKVIVGKDDVVEKVWISILAQGHVLLEDVPGASFLVVMSAPTATSITSSKPAAFSAPTRLLTVPPNWPMMAGATMAMTCLSVSCMAFRTSTICERSTIAPKGHDFRHLPQEMHFSGSICSLPAWSLVMAPTGQESSQGITFLIMAE